MVGNGETRGAGNQPKTMMNFIERIEQTILGFV